jgi:hypothetical protein
MDDEPLRLDWGRKPSELGEWLKWIAGVYIGFALGLLYPFVPPLTQTIFGIVAAVGVIALFVAFLLERR